MNGSSKFAVMADYYCWKKVSVDCRWHSRFEARLQETRHPIWVEGVRRRAIQKTAASPFFDCRLLNRFRPLKESASSLGECF